MRLRGINYLVILIVAILLPLNPLTAHAQTASSSDGISLQISPLPIDLNAKPGTTLTTDLRVRNASTKTERLQVKLLRVSQDNNGVVHLSSPGLSDAFVNWVSFDRTVFDAPSNQWQTIKMTVNVPSDAAFGYYWAVEYLRANAEPTQAGKAVARGAVATFILLNADATGAKRQAKIVSFGSDKKTYEFLPVNFSVKLSTLFLELWT